MSLISKQISELRAYAKDRKGELAKLVNDAADTIETLSTKLSTANLERSSRYYNGGWIPVSERLPEEDVEVLISYHYKDGEGDTSTSYIDITSYGQRYFGGNKVGNHKHWRAPFEYFESNYDVIAWQYLPEGYREEK